MQPANPTTAARPIQLHWHEARQAQHYGRGLLLRPMLGNEARPCPYGQEGDTRWVQNMYFAKEPDGSTSYRSKFNTADVPEFIAKNTPEDSPRIDFYFLYLTDGTLWEPLANTIWEPLALRLTAVQKLPFSELRESHADAVGIDELNYGGMGMNWEIGGGVTRDPLLAVALWLAQAYPVEKPDIDFVNGNFHTRAVVWEPQEPMVWAIEYEVML